MPVTAKLSKLFYERLGEQVANELVDWFNAVDATYRGDLRELNEVNFARFDAKLEQRLAELRAELVTRIERLEARLESKLDGKLDRTVAEHAFAQLNAKIDQATAALEAKLERRLGEQTRWLILAWATLLAAVIGLWIRG
jgi:hypothetical protein